MNTRRTNGKPVLRHEIGEAFALFPEHVSSWQGHPRTQQACPVFSHKRLRIKAPGAKSYSSGEQQKKYVGQDDVCFAAKTRS